MQKCCQYLSLPSTDRYSNRFRGNRKVTGRKFAHQGYRGHRSQAIFPDDDHTSDSRRLAHYRIDRARGLRPRTRDYIISGEREVRYDRLTSGLSQSNLAYREDVFSICPLKVAWFD